MGHTILILGGTTEARRFANAIAGRSDLNITLSLAGRTANPVSQGVPVRTGGFGGADGLAAYLLETKTDLLVDATHPFAAQISANALQAARQTGIAHFAICRPPWTPVAGDRWQDVPDIPAAIAAAGDDPRSIFVALGRQELAPLLAAPQHHYVIRSIEPVVPPLALPHGIFLRARGPFQLNEETALFKRHGIDLVIAKNSGGAPSYAKLAAARLLGAAVHLVSRPPMPDMRCVTDVAAAAALLDHVLASLSERPPGMERGV